MQKSRVILTLFSFPLVTILLLLVIFESRAEKRETSQKALGVTHANAKITSILFVPSPTPSPTNAPTPSPRPITPIKRTQRKQSVQSSPSFLPTDIILKEVNTYRASLGLSNVSPNSQTCEFAKTRAVEISSLENFNHVGFTKRVNEKTLPYPGYKEVTENIAYNTDPGDVVDRWIASPGHAENMRKNTQFVCIGKYGDYYTYEGWQP